MLSFLSPASTQETQPLPEQPVNLFAMDSREAFAQGMAAELIRRRNPDLGHLFTAERAPVYITILYRLLLFKREHELEPLHEDIYQETAPPLELLDQVEYSKDQFRTDLKQLADWRLITSRIEKQRLRGYRDNRKQKFRYRLSDEGAALLQWLEERLQDDFEERNNDARDLLGEVRGTLGELNRLLYGLRPGKQGQEDTARRIIFQLGKADDLCRNMTAGLIDLNGRLMAFLLRRYEAEEVRIILHELDSYVQLFLKQTFHLRVEIVPLLERLQNDTMKTKLQQAFTIMEKERRRAPHLLQVRHEFSGLAIPERLHRFFVDNGALDQLLKRINDSALQVWLKLRSHLQELERKNHRLEDLRERIGEIAALGDDQVPHAFFEALLAPAHGHFDLNYWDGRQKAEPPRPHRRISRREKIVRAYLKPKKKTTGPVMSMEEARLAELEAWLRRKVLPPPGCGRVGRGKYSEPVDMSRIMDLARHGILDNGRQLQRIALRLEWEEGRDVLRCAQCRLDLPKIRLQETEDR